MIRAATVGVNDHKTHMPMPEVSPSVRITTAAPTARHSTRTVKMAALLVSVSFVNMVEPPFLAHSFSRKGSLPSRRPLVAVPRVYARFAPYATDPAYSPGSKAHCQIYLFGVPGFRTAGTSGNS